MSKLTSYELALRLVDLSVLNPEGFTYHSETFEKPFDGFAVGGVYTSYALNAFTEFGIPTTDVERDKLIANLAEAIDDVGGTEQLQQTAFFFGGWGVETTAGRRYVLDIVTLEPTEDDARERCEERNQEAYGVFENGEYVATVYVKEVN